MDAIEYFVYKLMAPIILLLGLLGNTLGLIVLRSKKLIGLGSRDIYRFLLISDSIYLISIIEPYLAFGLDNDLSIVSSLACKIYWYFAYSLDVSSPWLLVYISVEKFISIRYPAKRDFLRNRRKQFLYFLFISIFNFVYYLPMPFYHDIKTNLNTSQTVCDFIDWEAQTILTFSDLSNRVLVPSSLMIIFTILLIYLIFKSRSRIINSTIRQNRVLKRNLRLALTSILLNVIYLILSLPITVNAFFQGYYSNTLVYSLIIYLFFICYGCNFYLILFSNSLFRKEFVVLFNGRESYSS